ncbi:hypothetical protein EIM92_00930 [Paenibacillus lentus]|uniref:Uncharacterized protein n=2 Tax=Paenibacillus lentus TaxID=1338368 RepID=A0A3S8RPR0_9BACL|nr:hypothetical protein EIM92_00930 [Paenibacillus lentus]
MDTRDLKTFEVKEKVFDKAVKGFWNHVNSWKKEEPASFLEAFKTFDISVVKLERERIALVINYRFDHPIEYVQATLNVILDERLIAQYHYLSTLEGEVMDDVLSFEDK